MHKTNEITGMIIGSAIDVHKALGPGLLESVYENCLAFELTSKGCRVERQKPLPVVYKDVKLNCGYRIDPFVEDCVIVEIKSVDALAKIHTAQLNTYMKLGDVKTGLLINFNVAKLTDGIKRWVL